MWTGVWKHECKDGEVTTVESETRLHPVHGHGIPPRCEVCRGGWKLLSWQGPVNKPRRSKQSRKKDWGYPGRQLQLFDNI